MGTAVSICGTFLIFFASSCSSHMEPLPSVRRHVSTACVPSSLISSACFGLEAPLACTAYCLATCTSVHFNVLSQIMRVWSSWIACRAAQNKPSLLSCAALQYLPKFSGSYGHPQPGPALIARRGVDAQRLETCSQSSSASSSLLSSMCPLS